MSLCKYLTGGFSPDLNWPLTRKERIQELDELYPLYCHSGQEKNIIAAKEYHSQFPADQIIPATLILFVDGRQVDEDDPNISMPLGRSWYEVCKHFSAIDNSR